MGLADETPLAREPHQDSFVPEYNNNVNATSVAIPQHQVYIHGYVMSSQPPQGPPRVYDLAEVEGRAQTTQYSNVSYPLPPPQYGATQYGAINSFSAPKPRPEGSARALVSIGYGLAWVFFLPHMLSVAASLHLHKKGALGAHKTAVLVCSYLEIAAFSLCAVASWSYVGVASYHESGTEESYTYDEPEITVFWFGFVYIALWGLVMLAVGIPRLILSVSKFREGDNAVISDASAVRFRTAALATYIVGVFVPPVQIASIACSLHLMNRGQMIKYQGRVMALAALEMFGWVTGASLSWFVVQNCHTWWWYSNNTSYYDQYCDETYFGYIFLCVQFGIAVACGIPRVVFTFKGKREGNYALIQ